MDEEIGILADKKTVSEIAREFSAKWNFKNKPPKNPVVLIVSGFQGAGKTASLEILKKNLDLIIISPDEIRHNLFERSWRVDDRFIHMVNATRNELLKKALSLGRHIAIDQLSNSTRIDLIRNIINENKAKKYKLLKIYLKTSQDTLVQRVQSRQQLPGIYKGTVDELKDSILRHGQPDLSIYDLVLDTEKLSPFKIAEKLQGLVDI